MGGLFGMGKNALRLAEATVPKISCIIRKMYGGSIPAMGVHQIGFDQVFAWPLQKCRWLVQKLR